MNWTIVTVIVCSMLVSSGITSLLHRYAHSLANDIETIKEQLTKLDRVERLYWDQHTRIQRLLDKIEGTDLQTLLGSDAARAP
jgi:hypothetical protein